MKSKRTDPSLPENGREVVGASQVTPVETGISCEILMNAIRRDMDMKKIFALFLAVALLLSCVPAARAAEGREFLFELSVDGADTKQVQPGDIITVVFYLVRTDAEEAYDMYAMQNEIRYDSKFLRLVEGSALLSDGIQTTDLGLRDAHREFYMNFLSMSGGEQWDARRLVGSIQLEVIGQSGVTHITNQDYLVAAADGQSHYASVCQDVTVILSTDCTVRFETNGGTEIAPQTVRYGEKIRRPEDPVREGFRVEGWYTDIDLKNPWNFETDTVKGNMTLYVKWVEGESAGTVNRIWWIIPVLILLALLLILILLGGRKTVTFETGCRAKVKKQKVRKGHYAVRPEDPARLGRAFAGWYADAEKTVPWDFDGDPVKENITLYAKWV